jgi:outer membrane protein assembly factor BamB
MKTNRRFLPSSPSLLAAASICLITPALADDWPQWRGPERNGISGETGLLKEWPAEGPPVRWRSKEVGSGYSTPSVVGERIFLLGNEGMENEFVMALAVGDASRLWMTKLGNVGANRGPQYPGARSTPTVDETRVYALGSDGDLACLDAATGEVQWRKNLRSDFNGQPGNWAYAESPLIDGDLLICAPGGTEATIVALNKNNGDVVWKSAIPEGDQAAYASTTIAEIGGVKQYIQFLQKGVVGIDAKTGKPLWRYERTARGSHANIPTPVAFQDHVYSGAGQSGGGLVKLSASDGAFTAEQVYFGAKLPTQVGGAVRVGEHLYGTTARALLCVEYLTGNLKWEDRSIAPGSLCYADERLYLHGENGEVALIEATPEAYLERGRFTPANLPDHSGRNPKAWAYPVIANGHLYIRNQNLLSCYNVKAKGEAR